MDLNYKHEFTPEDEAFIHELIYSSESVSAVIAESTPPNAVYGAPTPPNAASGTPKFPKAVLEIPATTTVSSAALASTTAGSGAPTNSTVGFGAPTNSPASSEAPISTNAPTLTPVASGILPAMAAAATNEIILEASPAGAFGGISEGGIPWEELQLIPFTSNELKVKPKQTKCPRKFVPANKKDASYYEYRIKNCQSVQRSRLTKEVKQKRMMIRLQYLEEEDVRKAAIINRYKSERNGIIAQLQTLQQRLEAAEKDSQNPDEESQATEENQKPPIP